MALATRSLGSGDGGFRRGDRRIRLRGLLLVVVELALRDGVLRGERCVALNVNLRELKLRLGLANCSLGLFDLRLRLFAAGLEGTRVDLKEDLVLWTTEPSR